MLATERVPPGPGIDFLVLRPTVVGTRHKAGGAVRRNCCEGSYQGGWHDRRDDLWVNGTDQGRMKEPDEQTEKSDPKRDDPHAPYRPAEAHRAEHRDHQSNEADYGHPGNLLSSVDSPS